MSLAVPSLGHNTWNTTITDIVGDMVTVAIRGKWCNYHAGGGSWLPIQSRWDEGANGEYEHTASNWSLIAPALATGRIATYQENDYDIFGGGLFTLTRTPAIELAHVNALPVEAVYDPARPYEVRYPSAFGAGASLLLRTWHARAMRPEHLVEITALPENGNDCEIVERVYTAMRIPGWNGETIDIGATGAGLCVGTYAYGMGMRPAVAWYRDAQGELVTQPISVLATRHTGYVELRKIVPRRFIAQGLAAGATAVYADETLTLNPNANVETTSVDGYAGRWVAEESFAAMIAGAGVIANDSAASNACPLLSSGATSAKFVQLRRGIYLFDTSSLDDGVTVTAAELGLYGISKVTWLTPAELAVTAATPASNTAIVAADYSRVGSIEFATRVSSPAWSTTGFTPLVFNAAGIASISLTGISKYAVRLGCDVDGVAPAWLANVGTSYTGYQADQPGTAYDPYLNVTYSAGGGGSTFAERSYSRGVGRGIMRGCA